MRRFHVLPYSEISEANGINTVLRNVKYLFNGSCPRLNKNLVIYAHKARFVVHENIQSLYSWSAAVSSIITTNKNI